MRINFRNTLRCLSLVAAVLFTSCGPKEGAGGGNALVVNAPLAEPPYISICEPGEPGGRLVIAQLGDPKTFNPITANETSSTDILLRMFAGLVSVDVPTQDIIPSLAESWKVAADNKTWTFKLRKNLRWSDGHPLTADDVVFKLTAPTDNSGVFIRIPEPPRDAWDGVNRGYEVQIENNGDDWHRTGCLYSLSRAREIMNARVGEWNTMLITLDGPRTRVEVNGRLVTDFHEGDSVPPKKADYEPDRGARPNLGYIGLQNHGDDARVHFKEVSVAPLR